MNPTQRFHSLDNLRAVMMWLGIVLHVAVNHMVGKSPLFWRDPETTLAANFMMAFIHTFRMPVFFILAGFFVALLMARRGAAGMMKHRLRRIGLPFLIFWPLIFVTTGFFIKQYLSLMPLDADGQPPQPPEDRLVNTMHLWFLYYLLWFCAMAALCNMLGRYAPQRLSNGVAAAWRMLASRWWGFLVLTLPLAVTGSFYWNGIVSPDGSFLPNAAELVHNGLFFTFGLYLYRHQESLLPHYVKHGWRYAGAGLVFFIVAMGVFDAFDKNPHVLPHVQVLLAYLYHCATWLWSFALIGLFMRHLPAQNRALSFVADSSYWVYLVHFPFTVGFGVLLYDAPYSALTKIAINLAATTTACLLTYLLLVRYTPVSALLNGHRHALPLRPRTLGVAGVLLFACGLGFTQIKFDANDVPTSHEQPAAVSVPDDIAVFLRQLGQAYGAADGKAVASLLSQDFLYQGMNRDAFLDHLQKNRQYFSTSHITPVEMREHADGIELSAYATSEKGVLAPSLQLLPLQAGAKLVKEDGKWKLHGNQQREEASLYQRFSNIVADFSPADLEAYRRHLPQGYDMPAHPYVRVSVTTWERMGLPQRPYRLAQLSILASKDGDNVWYLLAMPETDWLAVEAGKAIGFPKFIADIDIQRSLGDQWQVSVRRDGATLAEVAFDSVVTTKTSRYREDWPNNPDDWLLFDKSGAAIKASFQALAPPRSFNSGFGWMTVNPQAALWKELLAPGSRALAMHVQGEGAYKLHVYPFANTQVPAGIRQLLDANAAAWANQDMDAVLGLHHPAFKVTNQKDLAAMRKLFNHTRRYEWQVKELREDGDFAVIHGEIRTEAGAIPKSARLFRENGRWVFYGDGGSWQEQRRQPQAMRDAAARLFEEQLQTQAREVLTKHDDLRFATEATELSTLSKLSNAVFKPSGSGPFPALVLLPDCSGRIGASMQQRVEAGIAQGYVVMVVDSLRGHPNNCISPLRVSFERRIKDAYDALDHLSKMPQVDPQRIAVAGYSQGGTVALMLTSKQSTALFGRQRRFAAGAAWYPLCYLSARYGKQEADFLRQDIDKPLLLLMGGDDIYTPAYDCEPHLQELQAAGAPVEWHVFPQAGHGWDLKEVSGRSTFTFRGDRMTFSYDAAATQEGQKQMFEFFKRKLMLNPLRQATVVQAKQ
ncbi:dienelactone hydrolase [Paucimonas lemoignei]|uniref:Dienelactone hydrolase n=1 Tax=Paucimonas lemoignei TaxID=29443 RepID=A0A4R3HYT8_PAULE|nr:acyltransferase family protein [Paucimonas lemoignei]TCS37843.1 dienelactone hydrolase [Paucimonas lemoignei]